MNCGLASKAKTAGALPFMVASTPGAIFVAILLISASVSATAAIASGFFCKDAIIADAEYWRQSASSRRDFTLLTRPLNSDSSVCVAKGSGGGIGPYARSISMGDEGDAGEVMDRARG